MGGAHAASAGRRRRHWPWVVAALTAVVALGFAAVAVALDRPRTTSSRRGAPRPAAAPTTRRAAPTATASGDRGPTAAWVLAENARPGSAGWRLTKPATAHQIEGYAGAVSVDDGQPIELYVSTTARTFTVTAFRMGWYGGAEGRQVWTSGPQAGSVQPKCPLTPGVGTVACAWAGPLSVATDPAGWPPGDYLMVLTADTGYQAYVPVTVRDDASHAAYLVNNSVTTWQAYNTFGGYDLYQGPATPGHTTRSTRARIVSFDRPYALGDGAGDFVGLELPFVALAEQRGLDLSYTTDVDVDLRPELLRNHRAFVSLGHDEYYSLAMRQAVQAARDAGVNLAYLGANAIYRHIRFQASPLGPDRLEVDYKSAAEDPLAGGDPAQVTAESWRAPPTNMPESTILGEMWQCNPVRADMVPVDPTSWVWARADLPPGAHLAGVVGPEYDHYDPAEPGPRDVEVLAASPVTCGGRHSDADMTYYVAPSGAGVVDTGTIDWVGFLSPTCDDRCAEPVRAVTDATDAILGAFGLGPAGLQHPSTP
ncbi:MAG TPA: N,N-dimethylformamidase beta subunit family domain-containing protein [Acidimicrobiales bacterium]|nr:N,N-dimethylformamidase beta subunit family domain-containing protein [Acidimicrobiales bacterium]